MKFLVTDFTSTEDLQELEELYPDCIIVPAFFQDEEGYTKTLLSFEGCRSFTSSDGAVLIARFNVTKAVEAYNTGYGADKKVPKPQMGQYSHGRCNIKFEPSSPLWEKVKSFACLEFGADYLLDYQKNPTPLFGKHLVAVVEITGQVKAKDATRQDSFAIAIHSMEGDFEIASPGGSAKTVQRDEKAQGFRARRGYGTQAPESSTAQATVNA